jgi:hypothetical protein
LARQRNSSTGNLLENDMTDDTYASEQFPPDEEDEVEDMG